MRNSGIQNVSPSCQWQFAALVQRHDVSKARPLKRFTKLKIRGLVGECGDVGRDGGELLQRRHVQVVGMKVRNPKMCA